MDEEVKKEIARFQDNLQTIRRVAGWTASDLGNQIGVSKQTISNLENHNNPMTKTQYIAIRAVLDLEIATNSVNGPVIRSVMQALLKDDDEIDETENGAIADTATDLGAENDETDYRSDEEFIEASSTNSIPLPKTIPEKKKGTGVAAAAAGVVAVGAVVVPWLIRMTKGKR